MLARCLRRWLTINSRRCLVGCGGLCLRRWATRPADMCCLLWGRCRRQWPTLKQHSCQRSNFGQTEKIFLESPHSNRRIQHCYSKVSLLRSSQTCRGRWFMGTFRRAIYYRPIFNYLGISLGLLIGHISSLTPKFLPQALKWLSPFYTRPTCIH